MRIADFVSRNKEWIFSGIGVFGLGGVAWILRRMFFRPTEVLSQRQRSGGHSTSIQAGRDVKIDINERGEHGRK